jgi:hypothetical protein
MSELFYQPAMLHTAHGEDAAVAALRTSDTEVLVLGETWDSARRRITWYVATLAEVREQFVGHRAFDNIDDARRDFVLRAGSAIL